MTFRIPSRLLLAASLSLLLAGGALAQTTPKSDDKALQQAREELARAAKRVAALSRQQVDQVRVERKVMRKPVLGVLLAPDEQSGVRIAGVTPDSGAAKAGLKPGDRITSVDGRQILGSSGALRADNLRVLLGKLDAKTPVKLGYMRDGRAASVSVTPQINRSVMVWQDDGDAPEGGFAFFSGDFPDGDAMPGIAPDIRREVIRIAPGGACKGKSCKAPMLMSAFRWNGLNLASVDPQLGRYFGTDHGVLVLSSGELAGLQAGDVIQRIDGKPVASPREAMAALRGKPDGAKVPVEYLRDRKAGTARITVPKLMALPFAPPPPPPPPAPPAAPDAPLPPPAPPAPPKPV